MNKTVRGRFNKKTEQTDGLLGKIKELLGKAGKGLRAFILAVGRSLGILKENFLRSFAKWVDPKLEPYRVNRLDTKLAPQKVVIEQTTYAPEIKEAPETREDLFALIREAPMTVLNGSERKAMTAILGLPDVKVAEIMTPGVKVKFVDKDETLGPLILDRLYKSGFTFFPVVDGRQHIIGTLHTEMLNSLDVKETRQAHEVMEPRIYYVRADYSLEQVLKAFLRTNSQVMLVVDNYEKFMGMVTFAQLMGYLFDEKYDDGFTRDGDRIAVAKRQM